MVLHVILVNRYFTQLFMAEIYLTSPHLAPSEDLLQHIVHFMEVFLSTTPYNSLKKCESENCEVWYYLLPYIKLVYFPEPVERRSDLMDRLHMLCMQTVLLSLQIILGRDINWKILVKESLEDFVTCMPACLPPGTLREKAKDIVAEIRSGDHHVCPPKLINLAKAKLAKLYFGLEKIVNMSVSEIVNEVM